MTLVYSEILKKAWSIIWRNKYLWFFGLFLVWIGQEVETMVRNYLMYTEETLSLKSWQNLFESGFGGIVNDFWGAVSNTAIGAVMAVLLLIVVLVIVIWLMITSIGGIISSTVKLESGKPTTFSEGFTVGRKYFWKNFVVYFGIRIVDYAFLIVSGLVATLVFFGVIGTIIGIVLVLISFIISLIISFISKYAAAYIVVREKNIADAVRSAWNLFIKNWLASIEMAVIIFIINLIVSLALFLALVMIAAPFLLVVFMLGQTEFINLGNTFLYTLTVILMLLTIFVGSVLSGFQFSAWVLFFLRLDEGKKVSKLVQWSEWLIGRKTRTNVR